MSSASHVSYCFTDLAACLCLQTQPAQARGRVIPPFLPAPSPLTSQRSISSWEWGLISKGQVTVCDYVWQCLLESRQHCWVSSSTAWLLWISPVTYGAAFLPRVTFGSQSAVSFLGNYFKRNYDFPVVHQRCACFENPMCYTSCGLQRSFFCTLTLFLPSHGNAAHQLVQDLCIPFPVLELNATHFSVWGWIKWWSLTKWKHIFPLKRFAFIQVVSWRKTKMPERDVQAEAICLSDCRLTLTSKYSVVVWSDCQVRVLSARKWSLPWLQMDKLLKKLKWPSLNRVSLGSTL